MLNLQKCWNDGQTPVFIGMNWVFFSLKSGLHLCELKDFQLKIRCVFVGIEGVSAKIRLYGRIDDFWLKVYNVYIYEYIYIYTHILYIYTYYIYIDILYIYTYYIYTYIYIQCTCFHIRTAQVDHALLQWSVHGHWAALAAGREAAQAARGRCWQCGGSWGWEKTLEFPSTR